MNFSNSPTNSLWAVSSFEASADQIAEKCVRSAPQYIHWIGYDQSVYSKHLHSCISLPDSIETLRGRIGLLNVFPKIIHFYKLCRLIADKFCAFGIEGIVVVDFPSFHMMLIRYLKKRLPR